MTTVGGIVITPSIGRLTSWLQDQRDLKEEHLAYGYELACRLVFDLRFYVV
jgi:hypothetical protein